jgi:hypothetical protein
MPDNEFQNNTEPLLCSSAARLCSAIGIILKLLIRDYLPIRVTPNTLHRTDTDPEEDTISPTPVSIVIETLQPIVYSLFALFRRRLLRFSIKPL